MNTKRMNRRQFKKAIKGLNNLMNFASFNGVEESHACSAPVVTLSYKDLVMMTEDNNYGWNEPEHLQVYIAPSKEWYKR